MSGSNSITVAIPTYRRERVLVETLQYLLALQPPPAEILVLDQTEQHEAATTAALQGMADAGAIRWVRLTEPSIPQAMNQGLLLATQEVVLFLDDDIRPEPNLLTAHVAAHELYGDVIVAGRVIQPWEEGKVFSAEAPFCFAGLRPAWIEEFMGGNFSVRRSSALALGGFDENFVRVAYRFEAEFAHRWRAAGQCIWFEPAACLHHLKAFDGGTRSHGRLLITSTPNHAVGKYYFALRTMTRSRCLREFVYQPFRSVATRHHLRHPWGIPASFVAELRGIFLALKLYRSGAKLMKIEGNGEQAR